MLLHYAKNKSFMTSTPGLQFNKIGLDKKENMWLKSCSEAVESKPAKLETNRTVILPSMMRVFTNEIKCPTRPRRKTV